jgi:hypothetical protein
MGRPPSPQRLREPVEPAGARPGNRARLAGAVALAASALAFQASGAVQGPEAERALKTARVVDAPRPFRDVATPSPATLSLGGVRFRATWLSIDSTRSGLRTAMAAADETYRGECAAYQVDRLLQLGMVPATVERVISGARGALTLDVDRAMTESQRAAADLQPPDAELWERQRLAVRFFDDLIANADRQPDTILITADWRIRLIGHTRAFRDTSDLVAPEALTRFSRALLAAAERLDEATLKQRLARFASTWQIRALLERRDRLVALARDLAAKRGPDVVYYP